MDAPSPLRLRFDRFDLDEANAQLTRAGEALPIPPKAFDVLCALLRTPGMLVTKDQLLDAVWGHRHVSESVLKTTISELRGVLGDDARTPRFVETAARRGYRFIGAAMPLAAVPTMPVLAPAIAPAATDASVGRADERALLAQRWAAACAGERQVCWIAGEAGIGKTTLIDAFVTAQGPGVMSRGQCVEQFGTGEPYLPVLDALGTLCRDDAQVLAMLRDVAPTWLLQMPWLIASDERDRLRTQLSGVTQDRMLREFAELAERFSSQRPWLLVTEDLHWADGATLRLLDHMARRRAPARFMWLASFRLAELVAANHPLNALRHEWRTRRLGHEILLEPFSEQELGEYIARRASAEAGNEELVRAIHRQTDGLPLFVANVVDDLLDRRVLESKMPPDEWQRWDVPPSLAGLVEAQIVRLAAPDVRLLQAAAVCGVQFGVGVLASVLEQDATEVMQACDRLARGQHWIAPATVIAQDDGALDAQHTFRHALYRQVFYQRIGALERAQLHRSVGHALAQRREQGAAVSAAEIASHLEEGHDVAGALQAYVAAADQALTRFAPFEALGIIERASALLPQCPDSTAKMELELALANFSGAAHSQTTGVTSPQARAAFRRASELSERLPPSRQRLWAMTGLCLMHGTSGNYDDGLAIGTQLRRLAEADEHPALRVAASVGMAFPLMQQGHLQRAWSLIEPSIEATHGFERTREPVMVLDPAATVRALGAMLLTHLGRPEEGLALLPDATARAQGVGQPISQGLVLRCSASVHATLGNAQEVRRAATGMAHIVRTYGLSQGDAPSDCLLGWAEAKLGDLQGGRARIADGSARLLGTGARYDITLMMYLAADAAFDAGDDEAALEHLERGLAFAQELGERLHLPALLTARARIELRRGRNAAARASLQDALEAARSMGAVLAERAALAAIEQL